MLTLDQHGPNIRSSTEMVNLDQNLFVFLSLKMTIQCKHSGVYFANYENVESVRGYQYGELLDSTSIFILFFGGLTLSLSNCFVDVKTLKNNIYCIFKVQLILVCFKCILFNLLLISCCLFLERVWKFSFWNFMASKIIGEFILLQFSWMWNIKLWTSEALWALWKVP